MRKLLTPVLLSAVILLAACTQEESQEGKSVTDPHAGHGTTATENEKSSEGLLVSHTKNVTRLDANTVEEAAIMTAQTIWPATHEDNRPGTVILAPEGKWQISLAAADLIHHPNNGPVLFYTKDGVSNATLGEIKRLNPRGDVQVMVVGDASEKVLEQLGDYQVQEIKGEDPAKFAAEIDDVYAKAAGDLPSRLIIVSAENEAELYSVVAANWIAHMPEPVLYVTKDGIPEATKKALEKRDGEASIYVLGPEAIISEETVSGLSEFGNVTRISGANPTATSIAFAEFKDEANGFGWGVTEPGHGFSFASTEQPEFAIAGAPFAHLGKHAPFIWLEGGEATGEVHDYLGKLQPTFEDDPTVGPYNHAYFLGSKEDITISTQGMIDSMLEITPKDGGDAHSSH